MNFYESTDFGLRVTTYDLSSPIREKIRIRLIPMVHIGEVNYYREVEKRLIDADTILYEGYKMRNNRLRVENRKILSIL